MDVRSFEAERRRAPAGAGDRLVPWTGAGWGTKAAFELAREALGSAVEDQTIDVFDLSPETVGTFDVVLFLGVLYHVKDPMGALEHVASVTAGQAIIETEVDLMLLRRPAAAFYPSTEPNTDPTNWWGLNHQPWRPACGWPASPGWTSSGSAHCPPAWAAGPSTSAAVLVAGPARRPRTGHRAVFHAWK